MVTKGGKAALAFFVILIVVAALLVAWYCWKKQHHAIKSDKSKDSASTSASHDGHGSDDDEYDEEFALGSLGGRPCQAVDVHQCHSAACDACNPTTREEVHFIKAKKRFLKNVVYEIEADVHLEEGMSLEEGVEQEIMEEAVVVEPEKKKRKVMFASFFTQRAKTKEEPNVPTREVTVSVVTSGDMGEPEAVEVEP